VLWLYTVYINVCHVLPGQRPPLEVYFNPYPKLAKALISAYGFPQQNYDTHKKLSTISEYFHCMVGNIADAYSYCS
jgi:hypothetical protein